MLGAGSLHITQGLQSRKVESTEYGAASTGLPPLTLLPAARRLVRHLVRASASDLVVRRLLCATAASAAARYAEQQRGGGQRAPRAELAAQLCGRAAAAGLQLGPALEARLEAVAAVQVAQHLVVSPLAQQVVARRGRASLRDGHLVAVGARGGGGPLDLEELVKRVVGLCGEACVDLVVRLPHPEGSTVARRVLRSHLRHLRLHAPGHVAEVGGAVFAAEEGADVEADGVGRLQRVLGGSV
eukprot:scaffold57267_cov71-Phaeocystis_antarctica.AAC.1